MKIRNLILISAAILGLAGQVTAQTQAAEATVTKFIGTATITAKDGHSIPLAVGSKIPQGATITTTAASEVYLQTFDHTMATIKASTTVTVDELSVTSDGSGSKENTILNLKSGNLVAALDPAKKNVNNYQVRTPKGVAAARGTTFTVSYNGENYSIVTTSGIVQITNLTTGAVVNIAGGQASVSSVSGGAATAVADLPAADKAAATQAMAVAVATIAVAVDNNMLGSNGAAELKSAATTVITAAPEAAATIAALVQASAPAQSNVIVETTKEVAPQQTGAVERAVKEVTPAATPATPGTPTTPATPATETPAVTTPQPIDPTTVSRSGE
jgi:hypothetical protein